jgi:two-component system alkaline phosphatase synthesis response regulator PhoP
MEVRRNAKQVDVSAREFQLLRYFIEHRGVPLTREVILNGVWGYDAMPNTRTIDTHVTWLRQKLEENPRHPQYIVTIHGLGYRFAG